MIKGYEEIMHNISETKYESFQRFGEWEYAKDKLQLCIQRKGNAHIVKKNFLDMELYVRVRVDDTGSFIVKQEHLEQYGVNIDMLFSAA